MSLLLKRSRTKVIATVGPSCRETRQIQQLVEAGVDVLRVNMAHGDRAEHQQIIDSIKAVRAATGIPIGILVDLAGPKIRLGQLLSDPTHCHQDAHFRFVRGELPQTADQLVSNYDRLIDELSVDDRIMLADGTVGMLVTAKDDESVVCRVTSAGTIRSRQGINLPGAKLSVSALTDQDRANAQWAAEAAIDFVGLSFVRSAADLHLLRDLLDRHQSDAMIVAKIEKPEALAELDEVVSAADAVMVARGDLGVEIDIAETPVAQKRIIDTCHRHYKPVIVATQMLDSMTHARRPTRAEATDVANAILDGADACMLSGETAIGDHPCLVVETMHRIMRATEALLRDQPSRLHDTPYSDVHPITSAVIRGAAQIARQIDAKLVVVATQSGSTALVKSKQRDFIPTVGVGRSARVLQKMSLFWGILPLAGAPVTELSEFRRFMVSWGKQTQTLDPGDRVVFVTGSGIVSQAHNLVEVYQVPEQT